MAAVALVASAAAGVVWARARTSGAGDGASLTIVLDAHAPRSFAFTTDGAGLRDFSLDHDDDPAQPDRITFSDLGAGDYTVTQEAQDGWTLVDLTCSSPQSTDRDARRVGVTLGAGEAVTCTFTSARTRPLLGATRWDAWHDGDIGRKVEYTLGPERWRNRLPWFGEVTGPDTVTARADSQAVADEEIAIAADLGIDYFAFVWYGSGYPVGSDEEGLGRGLAYYRSSAARDRVQYTLEATTGQVADPAQRATILEYMRDPNWVHVGGRPLLFVGRGEAPDQAAYATLRAESKAQGTGNPYLVYLCIGGYKLADAPAYVAQGADAVSAYIMGTTTASGGPYATLAAQTHATWDTVAATGVPVVPTVMAGWDPRPRLERPPSWGSSGSNWYAGATPAELGDHLTDGLQWARAVGAKAVLAYAWNEYDEGGWLDRMYLDDSDRQAAIRKGIAAAASAPSLSVEPATVGEADTGPAKAVVKVRLANPPDTTVTVDFTTVDGTAVAPGDYAATKGTLTFAPGETVGTITVPVAGNKIVEQDETFSVRLSRPVGAYLGRSSATVTITNDDTGATATTTFVSDLNPTRATNGYGPVERDTSNGGQAAGDGRTITLDGVRYAKGLGVHAASSVVYSVPAGANRFVADVGVDDECASRGSVVFMVLVDGVTKYTSPRLVASSATATVKVPVTGGQRITLEVTDAGDGNGCDHADWAGARFQ
ncbi:MAG: NPCBM/NEW2 domain-containing protein [Actinomycetota bacterium]